MLDDEQLGVECFGGYHIRVAEDGHSLYADEADNGEQREGSIRHPQDDRDVV